MTTTKAELDLTYVAEHAQTIRLVSAGVVQAIALLLIITAPFNFVYGGREFGTVFLMLVATGLATWSLLVHHSQRGKPGE
jgi:hypothetical protein